VGDAARCVLVLGAACGGVATRATSTTASIPRIQSLTPRATVLPPRGPSPPAAYSIGIWPPGPRPPSEFVLQTSPVNSQSDHANLYGWDGSFLASTAMPNSGFGASVDGHYFVVYTASGTGELWATSGTLIRTFSDPTINGQSTSLNWAADGDYLCGLQIQGTQYALVVEDVAGTIQFIPLDIPSDVVPPEGLRDLSSDCSLTANRALVFGAFATNGIWTHTQAALISLSDGHPLSDFQLDGGGAGASADLHWLAVPNSGGGGWTTEIVDATDGTQHAKLGGYFANFTPDSQFVVGSDGQGTASIVDWRTNTERWTGPGHLEQVMAHSDPSTNKMLLWLSTGWAQAGTETYDYWIVDGTGLGFRLDPQGCAPIVASPARLCWTI